MRDEAGEPGAPLTCDALVVGSGAGGATTAALLAEAGLDVLVVEEGEHVGQGRWCRSRWSRWSASTAPAASRSPSVCRRSPTPKGAAPAGAPRSTAGCTGGRPTEVLQRWARRVPDRRLRPRRARRRSPTRSSRRSACRRCRGRGARRATCLRRGADRLGWQNDEIPRWMTYPSGDATRRATPEHDPRPTSRVRWRPAPDCVTGRRVDRLEIVDGSRAIGRTSCRRRRQRRAVRFGDVFVCGGAIQTPALLQRSGSPATSAARWRCTRR